MYHRLTAGLGALLIAPCLPLATASALSWEAYGGCMLQESGVGKCLGSQLLLDATPVGDAAEEGARSIKESVERTVGPGLYKSVDDVQKTGSFLRRKLDEGTTLLRQGMFEEISPEEFDRKVDDYFQGFFSDGVATMDEMTGKGLLRPLLDLPKTVDEGYENLTTNLEGLRQSVSNARDSAREGLETLVTWDTPLAGDSSAGGGALANSPQVAPESPSIQSAGTAQAGSEAHIEPGSSVGTVAHQEGHAVEDPTAVESNASQEDGATGDDRTQLDASDKEREPQDARARTEDPYENYRRYAAESEDAATAVGVTDIDNYESTSLQELNRRWDEENRRIQEEAGAVEIGVTRLEDPDASAALQDLDRIAMELETDSAVQRFRDTLEEDRSAAGSLEDRIAQLNERLETRSEARSEGVASAMQMLQTAQAMQNSSGLGFGSPGSQGAGTGRASGCTPENERRGMQMIEQLSASGCENPATMCRAHQCNVELHRINLQMGELCPAPGADIAGARRAMHEAEQSARQACAATSNSQGR